LKPDNRWWMLVRANNLRNYGDLEIALSLYEGILSEHTTWPNIYYEISWVYFLDQKYDKAIFYIEEAIRHLSTDKHIFYLRAGRIYEEVNEIDLALEAYKKTLSIFPNNPAALNAINRLSPINH